MRPLSIIYFGSISGTCLDRANALRRLGHEVEHIDLRRLLPSTSWVDKIAWRIGGALFGPLILNALPRQLKRPHYDLCYVDGGQWVTPKIISFLKKVSRKSVNYNIDDPFGKRDGQRFKTYIETLPAYDLCVVMRPQNLEEAKKLGAKKVMRVFMAADELAHSPREMSVEDVQRWQDEVLFLGTWMPERGSFLVALIERGVPLSIRGSNWHKAPEWDKLKLYWRGGSIQGDDYAKAIQGAKVNLGMLSKGNRDLHTTRSLEIPALGGLLCAERTEEHINMYVEGQEALFWDDVDECAAMCKFALEHEEQRKSIADAGHQRVKANGHFNEKVLAAILNEVFVDAA